MFIEALLERSVFHALRLETVKRGLVPNIDDYDIENPSNAIKRTETVRYEADLKQIVSNKGYAIEIFNYSNNHAYGEKKPPRIVVQTDAFLPGDLGTDPSGEKVKTEDGSYEVKKSVDILADWYFNIHLVSNSTNQVRELHDIMATVLPRRGYMKRYTDTTLRPFSNLFVTYLSNADVSFINEGIIEKVYRYVITDVHEIDDKIISEVNIPPIKQINIALLGDINNELQIK